MVSSSSRTGPVEGLISLARELRSLGLDARFAGDTVRSGENLGEHLAQRGRQRNEMVLLVVALHALRALGGHDPLHAIDFGRAHALRLATARAGQREQHDGRGEGEGLHRRHVTGLSSSALASRAA